MNRENMGRMGHMHSQWHRAVSRTLDAMLGRHDPFDVMGDTCSLSASLELHADDRYKTVSHKCGATDAGAIRQMTEQLTQAQIVQLVGRVCAKKGLELSGTHRDASIRSRPR